MELASYKPWVIFEFDDLDEISLFANPRKVHTKFFQNLTIPVVEFVPVTMTLLNIRLFVYLMNEATRRQMAGIAAQAHGSAFLSNLSLLAHNIYDAISGSGTFC